LEQETFQKKSTTQLHFQRRAFVNGKTKFSCKHLEWMTIHLATQLHTKY
jgi:hypothetical protein